MEHLTAGDPEGLQAAESGPALHPSLHHLHLQDLQLLHTQREIIAGSGPESIRLSGADFFPSNHFSRIQIRTYHLVSVTFLPLPAFLLENIILKVDGNEKLGGLKFLQLLGIGLGPWRSMSIFILNMPFANAKRISVSAHSSKMNRRLVCN